MDQEEGQNDVTGAKLKDYRRREDSKNFTTDRKDRIANIEGNREKMLKEIMNFMLYYLFFVLQLMHREIRR